MKAKMYGYRTGAWPALLLIVLLLVACHGGDGDRREPPRLIETQILSDPDADGDISFTPPDTFIITSARVTGSVLAGIDPISGDEFRGFLDFDLGGPEGVPLGARIDSATLSLFVSGLTEEFAHANVRLLIDLVSFQPPTLIAGDFDRTVQPPLLSLPVELTAADVGHFVNIDVTSLMQETQRLALPDFQLRFVFDGPFEAGLVEFEDSEIDTAPLLRVIYY